MVVKRKSISKKERFEVFKRDGFQCAYCGSSPPSVILEVDHIEPVSKGGASDINNYLTACFDCNRGKSNIELDKIPSKLSENIDVLKAKEEQLKEYKKFMAKLKRRETRDINDVSKVYSDHFEKYKFSKQFKNVSIRKFLKHLPKYEVIESLEMAISKINDSDECIRYFCGICWNKIKGKDKYER